MSFIKSWFRSDSNPQLIRGPPQIDITVESLPDNVVYSEDTIRNVVLPSRDLFIDFAQRRRECRIHKKNEIDRIEALLKLLSKQVMDPDYQKEQKQQKNSKWNLSLSNLISSSSSSNIVSFTCESCGLASKSVKTDCSLCSKELCPKCCKYKINVNTNVGFQDFPICSECWGIHSSKEEQNKWKSLIENSENHPLVSVYNVLTEVQQCIIKVMPRYQELMKTISKTKFPAQVENLPKPFLDAQRFENVITDFFSNFQIGLDKVKKIPAASQRDGRLYASLLRGMMQVQQKYLLNFRMLQRERKALQPKIIEKKVANPQNKQAEPEPQPVILPVIEIIDPETISAAGDDMIVRGSNFVSNSTVLVNSVMVSSTFVNSETLYVNTIPFPAGIASVIVRNPDGESNAAQVLLVSDLEDTIESDRDPSTAYFSPISSTAPAEVKIPSPVSPVPAQVPIPSGSSKLSVATSPTEVPTKFLSGGNRGWGHDPFADVATSPTGINSKSEPLMWGGSTISSEPRELTSIPKSLASKKLSPKISTIIPILSPPSGIPVTITGSDFEKNVIVKVGNIPGQGETTYIQNDDGTIDCVVKYTTPRLQTGTYSVSVTNPIASKSATMENVLVYISQEKWASIMNFEPAPLATSPPKETGRRVWG